jgi:hypothetical protein
MLLEPINGNDGGLLYRTKLGYDFGIIRLIAPYSGIEVHEDSINSVNLGLNLVLIVKKIHILINNSHYAKV